VWTPPKQVAETLPSRPMILPAGTFLLGEETASSRYVTEDDELRAYVSPMPVKPVVERPKTQVDLILPNPSVFAKPGERTTYFDLCDFNSYLGASFMSMPAFYHEAGTQWEDVLPLVERPGDVYETWKPSKSLDKYESVLEIWKCYNSGEPLILFYLCQLTWL
jgi:hypothetical protein